MSNRFSILAFVLLVACSSVKKELRYKEAIATMGRTKEPSTLNSLDIGLISGSMINSNNSSWAGYSFVVNGTKYGGIAPAGFYQNEKFVVRYDSAKLDNDHNYLVYYKPVFLPTEKTRNSLGKITKIYGLDRMKGRGSLLISTIA